MKGGGKPNQAGSPGKPASRANGGAQGAAESGTSSEKPPRESVLPSGGRDEPDTSTEKPPRESVRPSGGRDEPGTSTEKPPRESVRPSGGRDEPGTSTEKPPRESVRPSGGRDEPDHSDSDEPLRALVKNKNPDELGAPEVDIYFEQDMAANEPRLPDKRAARKKDTSSLEEAQLDELQRELEEFSRYDDDQQYVPKIEMKGQDARVKLRQDKYFTRDERVNFRSSVPFLHWFLLRVSCAQAAQDKTPPADMRASRNRVLPHTTAVAAGLRELISKRADGVRAECEQLHSEGRRAWHSLVNMCILLDDFCNACTKDFTREDGRAQWRKYMRIMHDIIDVQEHAASLSRKFVADAGIDKYSGDKVSLSALLKGFMEIVAQTIVEGLTVVGEETRERFDVSYAENLQEEPAVRAIRGTDFFQKFDKFVQENLATPLFQKKHFKETRTHIVEELMKQLKFVDSEKGSGALKNILQEIVEGSRIDEVREKLQELYVQESQFDYQKQIEVSERWLDSRREILMLLPEPGRFMKWESGSMNTQSGKQSNELSKTALELKRDDDVPLKVSAKNVINCVICYLDTMFVSIRESFFPNGRELEVDSLLSQTKRLGEVFRRNNDPLFKSLLGRLDASGDSDMQADDTHLPQLEEILQFSNGTKREQKVRMLLKNKTMFECGALLERTLLACHTEAKQASGLPLVVDVYCTDNKHIFPQGLSAEKLQKHWEKGEQGILDMHLASLDNAMCQDRMCQTAVNALRSLVPVLKALMTDEEWSNVARESMLTKCTMKNGAIMIERKTFCEAIEKKLVFYDDVSAERNLDIKDYFKLYEVYQDIASNGVSERDALLAKLHNARRMDQDQKIQPPSAEAVQKYQEQISEFLGKGMLAGMTVPAGVSMFRSWGPLLEQVSRNFEEYETMKFLEYACWRAALPVKGEDGESSRSRAVDEKLLKEPVKLVKKNLPEVDRDRLQKQDRGPAIDVYKKLREAARACESLVDGVLHPEDAVDGSGEKRPRPGPADKPGLQLGLLDSIIEVTCEADWKGVNEFMNVVRRTKAKQLAVLRCFCSADGANFLMSRDVRNTGLQLMRVADVEQNAPRVMFHCGDKVKVTVTGQYAPGQETDFYKSRLRGVLQHFTAEQMQGVEKEYEKLALAEDFHMKLSYMVADSLAMLQDVVDCMQFLLDKFGCDRWPDGEKSVGPLVQTEQVGFSLRYLKCEHALVPPAHLWKLQIEERAMYKNFGKDKVTLKDAESDWRRGIERRDPFVSMVIECSRSDRGTDSIHSELDAREYYSDVSAIRKAIYTVIKLRKAAAGRVDDETNPQLKALVQSLSCIYGDRADHAHKWDIFEKYIGSKDQEMYRFPERVWAEKTYLDIVHNFDELTRDWTGKRTDEKQARLRYQRLYRQLAELFQQLLVFRGDGEQVRKSKNMCRVIGQELQAKQQDKLTMEQLLKHTKQLVDEVTSSEFSYFDVYRRDAIRRRRIFSMTAVELWSESDFYMTRDARKVFLGQLLEDTKKGTSQVVEAEGAAPGQRYLHKMTEVAARGGAGSRKAEAREEGGQDQARARPSAARKIARMDTADPARVLYGIFDNMSACSSQMPEPNQLEIKEFVGSHRDVFEVQPCKFQIPVGRGTKYKDKEPLLDDCWGQADAGKKMKVRAAKKILISKDQADREIFKRILGSERAEEIAQRFVVSSIPDKYVGALALLLRVGISANSAARVMNSVPKGLQPLQMETYIRSICKAAFAAQTAPSADTSQRVQLHVVKITPYDKWAPTERARLLAMCAALKALHDEHASELEKKLEDVQNKAAPRLQTLNEELSKAVAEGEELGKQQDELEGQIAPIKQGLQQIIRLEHLIREFKEDSEEQHGDEKAKLRNAAQKLLGFFPDKSQEFTWDYLIDEATAVYNEEKSTMTEDKKSDLGKYHALKQQLQVIEEQIKNNTAKAKKLEKTINSQLNRVENRTIELQQQNNLVAIYGISPDIGIFVEKCMQKLFPGKQDKLFQCAKELMKTLQTPPALFKEPLDDSDLELCVEEFYDSRVVTVSELQSTLESNLEQARLARQMQLLNGYLQLEKKDVGEGLGTNVTLRDWRRTVAACRKTAQELVEKGDSEGASELQKQVDELEEQSKAIDILWFNSFVTDTPVGSVAPLGGEGAVVRAVSEAKLECLLLRKCWLAFRYVVENKLELHCPSPPSDQQDIQDMGGVELTEDEIQLVDGLLKKHWSQHASCKQAVERACAVFLDKAGLADQAFSPNLKLFSSALFLEAWTYCFKGADAVGSSSSLSAMKKPNVTVPRDKLFLEAEAVAKSGKRFSQHSVGLEIILGMDSVLHDLWDELTPGAQSVALIQDDALWKEMYSKVMKDYGFTHDALRIQDMLRNIWMVELLAENLTKPGDEDEAENPAAAPDVRRTGRLQTDKDARKDTRDYERKAADGFRKIKSVAQMASDLVSSMITQENVIQKYWKVARILEGSQGGSVAEAGDVDMLSAVRGVRSWVENLHGALARDKAVTAARGFSYSPSDSAERILENARRLIVARYEKYDKKQALMVAQQNQPEEESSTEEGRGGQSYDGPDYCSDEDSDDEAREQFDDKMEEMYMRMFEEDFRATLRDDNGHNLFHDNDSEDVKRVRFLYARLPAALRQWDAEFYERVKGFLEHVDRKYEELQLYADLDQELKDMDAKADRYQHLLSQKARDFRDNPTGVQGDAWVARMRAFIAEMMAREELYAVPATDKDMEQRRLDMYPYDPATDREVVALARRLLAQYKGMIRTQGDPAATVRYLFEKLPGPERGLERDFMSRLSSFDPGKCAQGPDTLANIQNLVTYLSGQREAARVSYDYDKFHHFVEVCQSLLDQYKKPGVQQTLRLYKDTGETTEAMLEVLFEAAGYSSERDDLQDLQKMWNETKTGNGISYAEINPLSERLKRFVSDMDARRSSVVDTYDFRDMDWWLNIGRQLLDQHASMQKRYEAMKTAAQNLGEGGNDPFHARNYAFELTTQQVRVQVARDILDEVTRLQEQLAEFRQDKEELRRMVRRAAGRGTAAGDSDDEMDYEEQNNLSKDDETMQDASHTSSTTPEEREAGDKKANKKQADKTSQARQKPEGASNKQAKQTSQANQKPEGGSNKAAKQTSQAPQNTEGGAKKAKKTPEEASEGGSNKAAKQTSQAPQNTEGGAKKAKKTPEEASLQPTKKARMEDRAEAGGASSSKAPNPQPGKTGSKGGKGK